MTRAGGLLVGLAVGAALALPARPAVTSAVTGEPLPGVRLDLPPGYLVLAPVLGTWDALSVLSIPQHLAVLGAVALAFLLWRALRTRSPLGVAARAGIEVAAAAALLAGVVGFYAVGALIPRPMARLHVDDPDVVVVDFHSHTHASHDGRPGFTEEDNRAWHRGAGFHVAYVTDHDSVGAAQRGAARNPARAGDGTVILVGREVLLRRQHVVVLGTPDPRVILAAMPEGAVAAGGDPSSAAPCPDWPVLVHTIPEDLSLVPVTTCFNDAGGVAAIELVDGAPRGLGQLDRERDRILAIADSLDLALVASSNLHGWGSTASGWSLLRIPGWRDMAPEEVGARIEETIRARGREGVEVVAYRRPMAAAEGIAAFVFPVRFAFDLVSRLSRLERLSWLLWGVALAVLLRARSSTAAVPVPVSSRPAREPQPTG